MEAVFTVKAIVEPNGDQWDCQILRVDGDSTVQLVNLKALSSSDIYYKTGIKTPAPIVDLAVGKSLAKRTLEEGIASIGSRTRTRARTSLHCARSR